MAAGDPTGARFIGSRLRRQPIANVMRTPNPGDATAPLATFTFSDMPVISRTPRPTPWLASRRGKTGMHSPRYAARETGKHSRYA
ncbi:MAG: hypothetical protein AVDCRST_MAG67-1456 [uncultured Solirubrobacteraceae bacterium]|uniref:Uncharacterized protein n=1 Tax=uncultured Solirubrobacteraceae bacterium TaxID=1162706 RepID=A0A6J4SA43_9ACTN|nr:MAG: hypothetical protein AVDCRST_MAG67-1456 [uncultured Solirubrobacteraceae bacterium]